MDLSLVGNKRQKKKKEKAFISVNIPVIKPGGSKYTEIDFEEYKRDHLDIHDDSSGDDSRFHDKSAVELARRLEAKYAKKGKKKRMRFHEDDFIDKSAGYDLEDGFIDDSEAFEEALPSTMETIKGGFYVNKGTLELRQLDEDELENVEEEMERGEKEKSKKKKNAGVETSESDSDGKEVNKKESKKTNGTAEKEAARDEPPVLARMTGAPPTKRALNEHEKNMEVAKRRKLIGSQPPPKKVPNNLPGEKEKIQTQKEHKRATPPPPVASTSASASTAPVLHPVPTSSNAIIVLDEEPEKSSTAPPLALKPVSSAPKVVPSSSLKNQVQQGATKTASPPVKPTSDVNMINKQLLSMIATHHNSQKQSAAVVPSSSSSPTKSKIEPICVEIKVLIEDLLNKGKKRLSDDLVDAFIKLENQMNSEKLKTLEQTSIFNYLSGLVSVSLATVKARMATRRIDLGNAKKKDADVPSSSSSGDSAIVKNNVQGTIYFKFGDVKHWKAPDLQAVNSFLNTARRTYIVSDALVKDAINSANNVNLSGAMTVTLMTKQIEEAMKKGLLGFPEAKHRKSRVYLIHWVQQSNLYWKVMCSKPRSKIPEKSEANLVAARVEFTEQVKLIMKKHLENKVSQQNGSQNIPFEYTEKFIGVLNTFMDQVYDAAVSRRQKEIIYTSLNATYDQMKDVLISKPLFFIEVCRRLPKLTLILGEEPIKSELARADLSTEKSQAVQSAKYALKWPDGFDPQKPTLSVSSIVKTPSSSVSPQVTPKGATMMMPKTTAPRASLPLPNSSHSIPSSSSSSNLKKGSSSGDDDIQVLASTSKGVSSSVQMPSAQAQSAIAQTINLLNHPGLDVLQKQALFLQLANNKDFNNMLEVQKKKESDEKKRKELEDKKKKEAEEKRKKDEEERVKKLKEEEERKKKEMQKKIEEERAKMEKQRKAEEERKRIEQEKIMKEMNRKIEEERIRKEAEKEKMRLAEIERKKKKEEEKIRAKEEERLRKEREAREAKERLRRAEIARKEEEERLQREMEAIRKKQEAEEQARKEKERQWRLEKEAADALQDLEQDNMMDDLEFLSEQQEKDDQQKQEAEKIRAEERAKQIETLRARQLAADEQRMKEAKPNLSSLKYANDTSSNARPRSPIVNIKQEPLSQESTGDLMNNFSNSSANMNVNMTNGGASSGMLNQPSSMQSFGSYDKLQQQQQQQQQQLQQQQLSHQYGSSNSLNQMNYGVSSSNQVTNQMPSCSSSSSMMLSHPPITQYQHGMTPSTSGSYIQQNNMMGMSSMTTPQVPIEMRQMNNYGQIPQNSGMMGMGFGNMMPQQVQQPRAQPTQMLSHQMTNQQQMQQQQMNQRMIRQQQHEWMSQQQKQMYPNQMNGNYNGYQ